MAKFLTFSVDQLVFDVRIAVAVFISGDELQEFELILKLISERAISVEFIDFLKNPIRLLINEKSAFYLRIFFNNEVPDRQFSL